MLAVCRGAAQTGKLDVVVAVWKPNAITLACAAALFRRAARQGQQVAG